MRYGFLIDQRKCIGCHACTVACKSENAVPLGSFRTWVKYVETGQFPDTERHFAVLRCNHCDNAPCVAICPVTALFKRENGIVDFNSEYCIGCKSCMQACPYDALYINPNSNTAEKCNFCAHRVEVGLQPACVIVCPEEAIVTGDLDNPESPISRLIRGERGVVRKPEQGTRPKLYYIGSDKSALRPDLQRRESMYMWSSIGNNSAVDLQQYIAEAEQRQARAAYDVPHEEPWGGRVAAYLWTKSIAAGAFFLPALAVLAGIEPIDARSPNCVLTGSALSLIFQTITAMLLVLDLKRPDRFLYILLRPQWKSWLAIGAYILAAFGVASGLCWMGEVMRIESTRLLLLPGALLAVLAAIYSGFLFAQAEGRDFWQSPLTTPHLLFQAVIGGAGIFGVLGPFRELLSPNYVREALAVGLAGHLAIMIAEATMHGVSKTKDRQLDDEARAARLLSHGPYKWLFWAGAVIAGAVLPALLLLISSPYATAAASAAALAGLALYERLWIKVGQAIPLS